MFFITIILKIVEFHIVFLYSYPVSNSTDIFNLDITLKVRHVLENQEENLTTIPDVRDAEYGKLYLILGVQHLQNEPAQMILPSRDLGASTPDQNKDFLEQQDYTQRCNYLQTLYKDDKNVQEVGEKFLLECIKPV